MGLADTLTLTAPDINFDSSALGSTVTITISLFDLFGPLDTSGDKTVDLAELDETVTLTATDDTETVVDVNAVPPRTLFLAGGASGGDDDTDDTAIASISISITGAPVAADGATPYTLVTGDQLTIVVTGDFTGLEPDSFCLDLDGSGDCDTGEDFTIVAGVATITIDGDDAGLPGIDIIFVKESGTVLSAPRTFGIAVAIAPAIGTGQNRTIAGEMPIGGSGA